MSIINHSSNEVKLIIALSKLNPSEEEMTIVDQIIKSNDYSPANFLMLLFEHRVAQIVFKNMVKQRLHGKLPSKYFHVLENYSKFVETRNTTVYSKLKDVIEELNKKELMYAPIKGMMLIHNTYEDYAMRYSNDIDILVQVKDLSAISTVLEQKGFVQCLYDEETGTFRPATKQQKIFHRMTTHELVPFYLLNECQDYHYIQVDIQFDIFNRAKNLRQHFNHDKLFENLGYISNPTVGTFTVLKPEYNILQIASHLYQDATRILSIRKGKDLELIKFLDLYEYIQKNNSEINWDDFAKELIELNVNHILFYALYYTEVLFGTCTPSEFMKQIEPSNLEYLNTYGVEENLSIQWKKPFVERMFDPNRGRELQSLDQGLITQTSKYYDGIDKLKDK